MKRKLICAALFAIGMALPAVPARAALFAEGQAGPATNAATTPGATTQGAVTSLKVTVVEVSGNVQVRGGDEQPWQAAKVGMEVNEGAEFRTGLHSSVRCTIPPDQSFTLDRLGTVKVLQALRDGDKLKTDMLMKYGRTKYSVEAAGLEHESTIASPSGTLAVRGTVVSLYDQPPFVPQAVSYTGQATFRNAHRRIAVGAKGGGKQTVSADKDSAAETALSNGVIDPRFGAARTASESSFIANEVSRGGVVSFDPLANILVLSGGSPIRNDKELAATTPGRFSIVARWFGKADVNLEVFADIRDPLTALFDPKGFQPTEFLYPGYGFNHSKSGGTIPFDHRGGPNGGTEIAFWANPPKGAVYGVGALLISGKPVDLKINAFFDGVKQSIFFVDSTGAFVKSKTLETTLTSANQIGGPIIFIPAVGILEATVPSTGDTGSARTKRYRRGVSTHTGSTSGGATSGNTAAAVRR